MRSFRHHEPDPRPQSRSRRPRVLAGSLIVLLPALALPALALAGTTVGDAQQPRPAQSRLDDRAATQAALEDLVASGTPGAIVRVDRGHWHWNGTAGVADLDRPGGRTPVDHFRVGSITKTFTAVTLLELEAEGRLSIDDTVEKWLPGLLDHNGYDGRSITVRQLLNHTSGVFDVLGDHDFVSRYVGQSFFDHRFDSWTPRRLVEVATSHPPLFIAGKGWGYSNTDYILAGMVIEAATGQSYADAVDTRILRPAGLHGSVVPGVSPTVPQPHARAYSHLFVDAPDARAYDVTEFDPSLAGAAGEIISTTRDLNLFFRELLSGSLLPRRQQRELLSTVETGRGYRYGLGVQAYELPCGTFWGNDGDIFGSVTYTVSTADGSHVLTLNTNDNWNDDQPARRVLTTELCG
jgi:D-alanyl-D-alanine carboxypeptidase